jgi:hypothetical protein
MARIKGFDANEFYTAKTVSDLGIENEPLIGLFRLLDPVDYFRPSIGTLPCSITKIHKTRLIIRDGEDSYTVTPRVINFQFRDEPHRTHIWRLAVRAVFAEECRCGRWKYSFPDWCEHLTIGDYGQILDVEQTLLWLHEKDLVKL